MESYTQQTNYRTNIELKIDFTEAISAIDFVDIVNTVEEAIVETGAVLMRINAEALIKDFDEKEQSSLEEFLRALLPSEELEPDREGALF